MKTSAELITASIMALALSAIPAANAALVSVNFNGFTGGNPGPTQVESTLAGPGGGLGTSWNQYAAISSSGTMVDSSGAPTSITVATTFSEGRYDGTAPSLTMLRAGLGHFSKGVQGTTVRIEGLEVGGIYDIWLVSHRHQATAAERSFGTWLTANTTSSSSSQIVNGSVGGLVGNSFVAGVNYVLFENVEANGSGAIVFIGNGARIVDGFDNNYRLHFNGLQIVQIPEPSTVLLGGLGLLAVIRRRRR